MMLFTFARILLCLNTQSVHTFLFIAVNLLSLSQLSPYGSGPASCPRMIKKEKYTFTTRSTMKFYEITSPLKLQGKRHTFDCP